MNKKQIGLRVVLSVVALCSLLATRSIAVAADGKQGASGNIIADSGFRPQPSGFAFENWGGSEYPYSDLSANDAITLFGERVCARWNGDVCVPTPAAKTWLSEMNKMMKGGHCEGMAAMSAAFHVKQESLTNYGAKEAFQLSPKDDALMSTISAYFATQALEPVQSVTASTRGWSLQKIVDTLVSALKSKTDYPTLGIYGANGGHAVTPYMVEQRANGAYRIYVYDNNYPGAEKYVDVDTARNRWSYAGAALNPKEDPAPWEGGAGDMDLTLLSSRYEPLACPFCGSHQPPPRAPSAKPPVPSHPRPPSKPTESYTVITPNRCSQIQATRKRDKKQVSRGKGGAKNEIPGVEMASLRGSRGCYVRLPANEQYDLSLVDDGLPLINAAAELLIFALGQAYGVANIVLSSGTSQVFSLGQSGFSYQAGGSQRPTIIYATDSARPNAYYEVSGFEIHNGYSFSAETSSTGSVTFTDNDPDLDSFDVHGEIVSDLGDEEVDLVDLSAGDKGEINLEVEDDGDIDVDIDADADGTEDEQDLDDDNDGTPDGSDVDDDNDGVADAQEREDDDYDGTLDAADTDDDNDGTPDASDADDDNDGVSDANDSDNDNDADDSSPDGQEESDPEDSSAQDDAGSDDGSSGSEADGEDSSADDQGDGGPEEQDDEQ